MSLKQLAILFAAILCLSACAGYGRAVQISRQYANTPESEYTNPDGVWRIYDKPNQTRLMIVPSLAHSFGMAFGGLTYVGSTGAEFRNAAQNWLVSVGRRCMVTDGQLLVSPQWEFRYACQ